MSNKIGIDPDNFATPLASSFGDVITLSLLSFFSSSAYTSSSIMALLPLLFCYLLALPALFSLVQACPHTQQALRTGWKPVLAAMAISGAGGKILNLAISKFPDIATFQPVINGVGGNIVSIHASRLSTDIHKRHQTLKGTSDEISGVSLLFLSVASHIVFILIIDFINGSSMDKEKLKFLVYFLAAAVAQISLLLALAKKVVEMLWQSNVDPDDAAIPYLSASADLLGGAFLTVAFMLNEGKEKVNLLLEDVSSNFQ